MEYFLGEVRNIKDPWKSGRVQVRIYGLHDDEQNVKDEHLAWAMPIQDITSAATGKVGTVPVGMVVGTRVLGTFLDEQKQNPVILGTYARAAKPADTNDNTGGEEGNDKKSQGVDLPSSGNPSNGNMGKSTSNPKVGGTPLNTAKDKYNEAQYVDNGKGEEAIKTSRERYAKNADKPTTASAEAGELKLPEILQKIDPKKLSAVLLNMVAALALVRNASNVSSPVSIRRIVTKALAEALAILAKKYNFDTVIKVFDDCLVNNGLEKIRPEYQPVVQDAISKLLNNAKTNGISKIKTRKLTYITFDPKAKVPDPIVTTAPDLYVHQYYILKDDQYPAYIQWKGPNGDFVYTLRKEEPYFETAEDDVNYLAEIALAKDLDMYINDPKTNVLTVDLLNAILDKNSKVVKNNGMEKNLGKNSSLNLMLLLPLLLGALSKVINATKDNHLPKSVLNQTSVARSLEDYSKHMSMIKKMKTDSDGAFDLPTAAKQLLAVVGTAAKLGAMFSVQKGGSRQTAALVSSLANKILR